MQSGKKNKWLRIMDIMQFKFFLFFKKIRAVGWVEKRSVKPVKDISIDRMVDWFFSISQRNLGERGGGYSLPLKS
jgi:hypothetical protein